MDLKELVARLTDLKSQLVLILAANVMFLVLYEPVLKNALSAVIFQYGDPLNGPYYESILDHLGLAASLFSALILLILLFYKRVKRLIIWFSTRERLFLAICLALLVSIQLCLISFIRTIPFYDSIEYLKLGNRLYAQYAYVNDAGMPTAYWPVGYPVFLALLRFISDNNMLLAEFANVIVSVVLVVVTYLVFRERLIPKERIVFILISTFLPNLIFSSNVLLTDYPFALLLWTAVLIYLRGSNSTLWYGALGLLFAVMSYLRPVALFLPVIFLGSLWRNGKLREYGLSIAVGSLVFAGVLAPWIIRNYSVFGTFVPISTNGGYNFYMGNRIGSSGGKDHHFAYDFKNPNEVDEGSRVFRLGLIDVRSNPIDFVKRLPKKIYQMYRRYDSSNTWALSNTQNKLDPGFLAVSFYSANGLFYLILYFGLFAFSAAGLSVRAIPMNQVLMGLYVYLVVITLIFSGNDRYLIPLMPIHQFLCAKFLSLKGAR